MTYILDTPNDAQPVKLAHIRPSAENVRRFVAASDLGDLRAIYRKYRRAVPVVLPDAPFLRFLGEENGTPVLEVLAGERRLTAANLEQVEELPCRIVVMTDEEAYKFILAHNDVAGLTTAELAFRAAEMDRLGFSQEEIADALKGASVGRYLTVGHMIQDDWFTDTPKLCDPSIVPWFEAAVHGAEHFRYCFEQWDGGKWDEKTCEREFRRRGKALPIDNAEKGFRITFDGDRFVVRGQVNLEDVDAETAEAMLSSFREQVTGALAWLRRDGHFGAREVIHINPYTV